jgi:hypothetical protein
MTTALYFQQRQQASWGAEGSGDKALAENRWINGDIHVNKQKIFHPYLSKYISLTNCATIII